MIKIDTKLSHRERAKDLNNRLASMKDGRIDFIVKYFQEVADEARKEERERCANIADEWTTEEQRKFGLGGPREAILGERK